jgi:hypothetical protein
MTQAPLDTPNATASQLKCPSCGGTVLYDPEQGTLLCRHCAARAPLPPPTSRGPRELRLDGALEKAPRGYGTEVILVECGSCGAAVNLEPHERATKCTYCASPTVVTKPPNPDLLQPESLIPFRVTQAKASLAFNAWMGGLWFRPGDLARQARVEGVHGIYLPYWTFDTEVSSRWEAERGEHYYTTESYEAEEDGRTVRRTRQVQHTRWHSAHGRRKDKHDDVLICATKGVREGLARELCDFDTTKLVAYSPGYLCGSRAEAYAIDLHDAWRLAQARIDEVQKQRCADDVGGDTHRNLEVHHDFDRETFKHVLLPLFVLAYRYNGRPYQVLVNGQTAAVVGKAPLSLWKVMALGIPVNTVVWIASIALFPVLIFTVPLTIWELHWLYKHRGDFS